VVLIRPMFRPSRTRRFGSWLALAVFALNALWPLLSLANPGGSQAWMEICTPTGMQKVTANEGTPAEDGRAGMHVPQCPLCVTGGGMEMAGAPPVTVSAIVVTPVSRLSSVPLPAAKPVAYASAQPRAPPVSS